MILGPSSEFRRFVSSGVVLWGPGLFYRYGSVCLFQRELSDGMWFGFGWLMVYCFSARWVAGAFFCLFFVVYLWARAAILWL